MKPTDPTPAPVPYYNPTDAMAAIVRHGEAISPAMLAVALDDHFSLRRWVSIGHAVEDLLYAAGYDTESTGSRWARLLGRIDRIEGHPAPEGA